MKSDKGFFVFLKELLRGKRAIVIAAAVLLALILIFLPSQEEKEESVPAKNETETRIEALCASVEGVGECRVMVTFENERKNTDEQKVYSVAVVCDGADDIQVRASLVELISSLYGIGSNRISVIRLEK